MGIFRKKLDAKEILFPLQKDLVSSVYELRKTTLDDSRRPKGLDSKLRVGDAYREAGALVFFLIFSPIKLSNLPSSVEMLLVGVLKAWAMTMTTGFEKKDEKQKFIESRFDEYYRILESGYDAAEICSKYLDFYGLVDHENDIVQNLSFTSFIDGLFLFSMQIVGAAKKDYKIIYTALNQSDLDKLSAQYREIHEANKITPKSKIDKKEKPKSLMDEIGSSIGLEGYIKIQQELWGENSSGCSTDEMPNGIGEFGLESTNPIPVNATHGSELYLDGLRAPDGSKVISQRQGSLSVDNIEKLIDMYYITHENGDDIATIYISSYQAKNSKKAPKGLKQVSTLL